MESLEAHIQLFGRKAEPTELQKEFYAQGVKRGFSSHEQEPEQADATLIRALAQVLEGKPPTYHEVYLFFPASHKLWVHSRIHNIASATMKRLQPILKEAKGKAAISHVRQWLETIKLGPLEAWASETPPERWALLGYTTEDNIPEWAKSALL